MNIDIAGKLFPNVTAVTIQLCSTGIILFFFKKLLWTPMRAYFEKRANSIESTINETKEMSEKAKTSMVESGKQARESAKKYRGIVKRAEAGALKVRDDIVADMKEEASNKLKQAEREIEAEKQQAKEEMKEEMVDIAIEVAAKVLSKEMNSKENQQMVEDFVGKVVN